VTTLHVQAEYFLETTFWEALVRALEVEGDFEYIHLDRGEPQGDRILISSNSNEGLYWPIGHGPMM